MRKRQYKIAGIILFALTVAGVVNSQVAVKADDDYCQWSSGSCIEKFNGYCSAHDGTCMIQLGQQSCFCAVPPAN